MVDRVEEQFDIKPERLIGDTAYGTAPMLAWMVEDKDIKPHVPGWDTPSARTTVSLTTISTGMRRLRNTAAQLATHCAASGELRNVDAFGVAHPGVDLARTTCHEFFCEGKTETTVGAGSECNGIFQSRRRRTCRCHGHRCGNGWRPIGGARYGEGQAGGVGPGAAGRASHDRRRAGQTGVAGETCVLKARRPDLQFVIALRSGGTVPRHSSLRNERGVSL